jgi:hypothetical protein
MNTNTTTQDKKKSKWPGIILVLIAMAVIGSFIKDDSAAPVATTLATAAPAEAAPAPQPTSGASKFDAYGMCCEAIHRQYDNAEGFQFVEATDMGPNEWIIQGRVKLYNEYGNQVPHRFTAQIKHTSDDKWQLVYPVVYN